MADLTSKLMVIIDASSAGAVRELDGLQRESKRTGDAFDAIGKKAGLAGSTIKAGLVAGATALIGSNLVSWVNDSISAFGDSAKAAGDLAAASGGTVEGVSAMTAALADAGVSSETTAGLLTKFTTNAGKSKDTLDGLGVVLRRNKDGTVDYADGMVQAVDAITRIGDASVRNQKFVELFGKQGARAFQDLAASGVPLSQAMEAISKYRVFTSDDVGRAVAYDDAMDQLDASVQSLQFALGRDLIPAVAGTADALAGVVEFATPVLSFLASVPTEVYLVAGAAVLLSRVLTTQLVAGAFSAVQTGALVTAASLTSPTLAFGLMGAAAQTASAKIAAAFAANPVTAVLVGLAAAYAAFSFAQDDFNDAVSEGVTRVRELEEAGQDTASAVSRVAREMESSRNVFQNFWAALRNTGGDQGDRYWWQDWLIAIPIVGAYASDLVDAFREGGADAAEYEEILAKVAEEAGQYAAVSADAAVKQEGLNEMLAKGEYTTVELAAAVRDAADAQAEKNRVDELSKGLIEVQLDSTVDAVKATRELIDAEWAAADAKQGFIDAVKDQESSTRDVAEAALEAADAAIEQQRQADQLAGVYRDQAFYTNLAVAELERLRDTPGTSPEQQAGIQELIDKIRAAQATAGEGVFVPLSVEEVGDINAKVADLKARINAALSERNYGLANALQEELYAVDPAALPDRIRAAVDSGDMGLAAKLTAEYNAWAAGTGLPSATLTVDADTGQAELKVGALTESKTVPVTVTVDGVDGAKQEVEALAVPRETTVTWATEFTPDGYNAVKARVDYLAQARTASLVNEVVFAPDGYLALKDRKDYLAQNRTATITINQVTGSRVAVGGGVDEEGRPRRIPNLYANVQPTNIVKVAIDGQPLRAWIRSEVAAAQPVVAGVA